MKTLSEIKKEQKKIVFQLKHTYLEDIWIRLNPDEVSLSIIFYFKGYAPKQVSLVNFPIFPCNENEVFMFLEGNVDNFKEMDNSEFLDFVRNEMLDYLV